MQLPFDIKIEKRELPPVYSKRSIGAVSYMYTNLDIYMKMKLSAESLIGELEEFKKYAEHRYPPGTTLYYYPPPNIQTLTAIYYDVSNPPSNAIVVYKTPN